MCAERRRLDVLRQRDEVLECNVNDGGATTEAVVSDSSLPCKKITYQIYQLHIDDRLCVAPVGRLAALYVCGVYEGMRRRRAAGWIADGGVEN